MWCSWLGRSTSKPSLLFYPGGALKGSAPFFVGCERPLAIFKRVASLPSSSGTLAPEFTEDPGSDRILAIEWRRYWHLRTGLIARDWSEGNILKTRNFCSSSHPFAGRCCFFWEFFFRTASASVPRRVPPRAVAAFLGWGLCGGLLSQMGLSVRARLRERAGRLGATAKVSWQTSYPDDKLYCGFHETIR